MGRKKKRDKDLVRDEESGQSLLAQLLNGILELFVPIDSSVKDETQSNPDTEDTTSEE